MTNFDSLEAGMLFTALIVLCCYFTLTFFEYLRKDDERIIKQSKIGAVICIALALIIAIIF
ncbi:hypothetical protein [Domibacillus robiginosus]|uniref:hypothetical protein n=1 Tax=Domibacillus robiginosus TaxID=1071054 RepID=UPI00067E061C|nr:hypothetical protein [Domibacillus robiginosus]